MRPKSRTPLSIQYCVAMSRRYRRFNDNEDGDEDQDDSLFIDIDAIVTTATMMMIAEAADDLAHKSAHK